jgi:phenylpyruvate tautomerase PptA (4-oxalocrotonate tautomerase family)
MPCIVIRAKKTETKADIGGLARELSEKTGIGIERINIIVDYFDPTDAFIGSNKDQLIITIWISETNEPGLIKSLSQTIAALAERYFGKEANSTAVMCNLVREGYMFINNQFK